MSDPYFVALYRAAIAAFIVTGSTVGTLIATGADTRQVLSALIVGVCLQLGVRFLGEGTIDSQRRSERETELVIQDAARAGFIASDAPFDAVIGGRPVDFDEDYHFSSDNETRHRGRLASDCPICLRENV